MSNSLPWITEEIRAAAEGAPPSARTYCLEAWCGEEEDAAPDNCGPFGWVAVASGLSQWGLRRALEMVYARGYSAASLYAREETDHARTP